LEAEAKSEIISDLIVAADNEWLRKRAEEEALGAVAELLAPTCRRLDENVAVQTYFVGSGRP
jgi:hypothetical protein